MYTHAYCINRLPIHNTKHIRNNADANICRCDYGCQFVYKHKHKYELAAASSGLEAGPAAGRSFAG